MKFLCASSAFSASLWLEYSKSLTARDAENAEETQRVSKKGVKSGGYRSTVLT
jgi:hypothetical protein